MHRASNRRERPDEIFSEKEMDAQSPSALTIRRSNVVERMSRQFNGLPEGRIAGESCDMRTIRGALNGYSDRTRRGRVLKPKLRTWMTEVDVDWHQLEKPAFCCEKLDFSKPGNSRTKLGEGSIQAGTRYSASPTCNNIAPSLRQLGDLKMSHRTNVTTARDAIIVNVRLWSWRLISGTYSLF